VNVGVIEGFFGKPWEWSARLSGLDFLRDRGYQFYIYAPKADPVLRRRWREPMPKETLRKLSELAAHGASNGVSIGVGLTPFEIYLNYDADAQISLRSKVRQLNETGADVLCSGCPCTSGLHHDHAGGNLRRLTMDSTSATSPSAWHASSQIRRRIRGRRHELIVRANFYSVVRGSNLLPRH
jgi:hypothetical protein